MLFLENEKEMFEPMKKYIPEEFWDYLMYMGNSGEDNKIYLYKHVDTRHYINLDKNGKFYLYIGFEIYKEIDKDTALSILIA